MAVFERYLLLEIHPFLISMIMEGKVIHEDTLTNIFGMGCHYLGR